MSLRGRERCPLEVRPRYPPRARFNRDIFFYFFFLRSLRARTTITFALFFFSSRMDPRKFSIPLGFIIICVSFIEKKLVY